MVEPDFAAQQAHPNMLQAYQDIWSMASALEEGQTASAIAAERHKQQTMGMEPEVSIALPSGFVRPYSKKVLAAMVKWYL